MIMWATPDDNRNTYYVYIETGAESAIRFATIDKVHEHKYLIGDRAGNIYRAGWLSEAKAIIRKLYVKSEFYKGEPIE